MDSQPASVAGDARRVYFRDVKPYAIVDRLDQLRGPAGGTVELSHSVLWAPGGGLVDLDRPGRPLRMSYRAVLNEGTVEDLVRVRPSPSALSTQTLPPRGRSRPEMQVRL
jgi:hypothetical protein